MPKYISRYVPIEFAVARIAKHFHRGDEVAAWEDLALAIKEGAITKRPLDDPRINQDDMLSNIVARVVVAKGQQPVGEDNQELKNWPKGTYRRGELEEIYGQIFTEDGGATGSDRLDDKQIGYPGRPSQMAAIKEEMRRRDKDGGLKPTLAAEARVLRPWAVKTFPGEQTPQLRSIENGVRELYQELRKYHLIK